MTTFDDRLRFAQDRVDHLEDVLAALVRARTPMRTDAEPRLPLAGLPAAAAARLADTLLDQVPHRRITQEDEVLVLAAAGSGDVEVVVEAEAGDAPALMALSIGLDGVWAKGAETRQAGGRPVRRARFPAAAAAAPGGAAPGPRLAAVHLRLDAPGEVRLTRLAVVPA